MRLRIFLVVVLVAAGCFLAVPAWADSGSILWLRAAANGRPAVVKSNDDDALTKTAQREISTFWHGKPVRLKRDKSMPDDDGYAIEPSKRGAELTVRARRSAGLLYGAYELLRQQVMAELPLADRSVLDTVRKVSRPAFKLRMLNHCVTVDSIGEGGYEGRGGLWNWDEVDAVHATMSISMRERLIEYCRANASLGINATVLNFSDASPLMLSAESIKKVKVVAALLRLYGIRVFLKVDTNAPVAVGRLSNSNPFNTEVRLWWKNLVREVYRDIPDFGGFLVDVPSGGQSSYGEYALLQAELASVLAEALTPHKGLLIRNGSAEMGLTVAFINLGAGWSNVMRASSTAEADGVAGVFSMENYSQWCADLASQTEWYTFGRMAWNPSLTTESIETEWLWQVSAP